MTERQTLLHALLVNPAHMLSEHTMLVLGQILDNNQGDQYADFAKIYERNAQAVQAMNEEGILSRADKVEAAVPKIGVLNIRGTIAKESSWWYDIIGTKTLAQQLRKLAQEPNVKGIILKIESGGGQALATHILKKAILEVRASGKKVVAYVEDLCASAAYDIASVCDEIWVNHELAQVGSIGTFLPLVVFQGIWEKMGAKFHEIYATKSTEKNKDFREAIEGKYANIRKNFIDPFNEAFLASVQKYRPHLNSKVLKGRTFLYEDAKKYGLVDKLGTLEECGQSIFQNPIPNSIPNSVSNSAFSVLSAPMPHQASTKISDKMPDETNNEISKSFNTPNSTFKPLNLMNGFNVLSSFFSKVPKAIRNIMVSSKTSEKGDVVFSSRDAMDLGDKIVEMNEELEELKTQVSEKENTLQALQNQHDTDKEAWKKSETKLNAKVSELEADVKTKTEVIAKNKETIADQEKALSDAQAMLTFMGKQPGSMPSQAKKKEGDTPQKVEEFEDPNQNYRV